MPGLLSTTSPTTWRIFVTGEFQPRLLGNICDKWVPSHVAGEYLWQVSSIPCCWRIFVTGEFYPMLLENICDRCVQDQTAGIITMSGSVDYSAGRLTKMLQSQARCTEFCYTSAIQRSSSRVKLRLCLAASHLLLVLDSTDCLYVKLWYVTWRDTWMWNISVLFLTGDYRSIRKYCRPDSTLSTINPTVLWHFMGTVSLDSP